jgi:hypothetical protein
MTRVMMMTSLGRAMKMRRRRKKRMEMMTTVPKHPVRQTIALPVRC